MTSERSLIYEDGRVFRTANGFNRLPIYWAPLAVGDRIVFAHIGSDWDPESINQLIQSMIKPALDVFLLQEGL